MNSSYWGRGASGLTARLTTLIALALLSAVACRSSTEVDDATELNAAEPVVEVPTQAVEAIPSYPEGSWDEVHSQSVLDRQLRLTRAEEDFYGIPVPNGLHLEEEEPGFARAESSFTVQELTNFYDRLLGGRHNRRASSVGAVYEPWRDIEPTVLINPGPSADSPVVVVYDLPDGVDPEGPFSRRRRGPRPPSRPRLNNDGLQLELPEGYNPTWSSEYYFETTRVREDGTTVRVLTLRDDGISPPAGYDPNALPPTPWPEHWYRLMRAPDGDGFDRGDGQRSLSATVERGRDGEPLPFAGNENIRPVSTIRAFYEVYGPDE